MRLIKPLIILYFITVILGTILYAQTELSDPSQIKTIENFKDSLNLEIKSTKAAQKSIFYCSLAGAGISILLRQFANQSYDDYQAANSSTEAAKYWNKTINLDRSTEIVMGLTGGFLMYSGFYCKKSISDLEKRKKSIPLFSTKIISDSIISPNIVFDRSADGGIVLLGVKKITNSIYDMIFSKISVDLQVEVENIIHIADINIPLNICQTSNTGYYVLCKMGAANQQLYKITCLKIDTEGKVKWKYELNDTSYTNVKLFASTPDSGCLILMGKSMGLNAGGTWSIKIDANGRCVWEKHLDFIRNRTTHAFIQQVGNDFYFTRKSIFEYSDNHLYLYRIDESANLLRIDSVRVGNDSYDCAISRTKDAGYIILLNQISLEKDKHTTCLVKVDSLINIQWEKSYENAIGFNAIQDKNTGFIVTGEKNKNIWVLKIDAAGNIQHEDQYKKLGLGCGFGIIENKGGSFILLGTCYKSSLNLSKSILLQTYSFN